MGKGNLILTACLIGVTASFIGCRKEVRNVYQNTGDSSRISITNASPGVSNLQFFLNNKAIFISDSPFVYGSTTYATYISNVSQYHPDTAVLPYIKIPSGYQQLGFGSYGSGNIFSSLNNDFATGGSYSVFITDTIHHGQVTTVLLEDYVGAGDSTKGQIRFLNLSPDAPPLDVWAYPDGINGYKIFSGCAYLANDFNSLIKAQSFTQVAAAPYYFEATLSGTADIVLQGQMIISPQSVTTIYTKGYMSGTGSNAIDVGVIQYKP